MNEKKLTDEEIVKALEHCYHNRSCEYCYHNDENGSGEIVCRSRLMGKALYLIHRLQAENAEGKARMKELTSIAEYQQHSNIERWGIIQEKDKEIERLTEENEYLDMCGKQFLADYQKCEVERAELENQVDELKKERENVQKILYELGKCGNDKERYAVWVKLIKYCGVEVE